jgi:Tfp pilus assembly protein PilF
LDPEPTAAEPPQPAGVPERRPLPLWRRMGIAAACLLIAAGAVILVVHFVQARQPGQASSGSVSLSQAQLIEQQLQQALALNNDGNTKEALELYDKVLSEDPSNPAALAYAGYLQWNVGSSAHVATLVKIGRAEIETSVKDSPSYYQGHLFYGLVLENQDHNDAAAVTQFNDFLADDPPSAEPSQVAALVAGAYQGAGVPVPSAFSGGTATGTSAP